VKRVNKDNQNKPKNKCLVIINMILNNRYYTIFMTIITIYALFGDDFRLLLFGKEVDDYFFGITSA
jgi:hypothetical protein